MSWRAGWLRSRWIVTVALGLSLAVGILLRLNGDTPDEPELIRGEATAAVTTYAGFLPDGRIDLNAASVDLLMTLPGIGEVTANEIVRMRTARQFGSVAELDACCELSSSELAEIEKLAGVQ